jgi:fructose-1,6-bisphosphatase II
MPTMPDRNLALELVRVTEAAALACAKWVGRGDKIAADQAAVDAMRLMLDTVQVDGVVVIGEGEKDEAPMLFNGERVGNGTPPEVDVAVDPLEGTNLCAKGKANALAVIAMSERGTMFDPGPCVYMEKLVTDAEAADAIDIERPLEDNLRAIAKAKGKQVNELMLTMLERPRHDDAMRRMRELGVRIRLITDGDVSGALAAARPDSAFDALWGIGGTPEGVLSAAAIRCLGGVIQGRLYCRDDAERDAAQNLGYDLDQVLTTTDLVSGKEVFFAATGVTRGDMLDGVQYRRSGATTESIVMRSRSGTVRVVSGTHSRDKLAMITGDRYFTADAADPEPVGV